MLSPLPSQNNPDRNQFPDFFQHPLTGAAAVNQAGRLYLWEWGHPMFDIEGAERKKRKWMTPPGEPSSIIATHVPQAGAQ